MIIRFIDEALSYFICGEKLIKEKNLNFHYFTVQEKKSFINIKTVFFFIHNVGFPARQDGFIFLPFEKIK